MPRLTLSRCLARLAMHTFKHVDRGSDLEDAVVESTADLLDDVARRLDPEDERDVRQLANSIRRHNGPRQRTEDPWTR